MTSRHAAVFLWALAAGLAALLSIVALERQRAGLTVERLRLASSPVTLWRPVDSHAAPLVVLAHGYSGSRQMMQALAMALARAGFVAAFDFHGHGRHPEPMAGDITSLDGTTAQLVDQTIAVTRAARARQGVTGPSALVGHSMATDIVIRAAERIDDVAAVVAISILAWALSASTPLLGA